jgi:hypothetical protein
MLEQKKGTGQGQSGRASPDCDGVFRHINKLQMLALAKAKKRKDDMCFLYHEIMSLHSFSFAHLAPLRENGTLNLKQIKPPTSRDEDASRNLTGDTRRFI